MLVFRILKHISRQNHRLSSIRSLSALLAALLIIMSICLHGIKYLHLGTRINISSEVFLMNSSELFVISLPTRQDRRRDMERLRTALGLDWKYINAMSSESPLVQMIMNWVQATRHSTVPSSDVTDGFVGFSWPNGLEELAKSTEEINLWVDGNSPWDLPFSGFPPSTPYPPIVCAEKDYTVATLPLPEHMILTAARVACWHSHLAVIHKVANNVRPHGPGLALIFEDDVDMEKNIDQQTRALWRTLPDDWDIVFLGHCWSDETRGSPLPLPVVSATGNPQPSYSRLYASTSPKCTHAYALSRIGARRLLLHLRYPLFAYSRAIDQALAWLVESGRLKGFSAVPSLVVQTKLSKSDVMPGNGTGSKWKDVLIDGVLQNSIQI